MKDTCIGCGSEQIVKRTNVLNNGFVVSGYHCIQCSGNINRWVSGAVSYANERDGVRISCPSGAVFIFGEEPA